MELAPDSALGVYHVVRLLGYATGVGARFPALSEAAIASAVSRIWHSITGALLAGIFNALNAWTERRQRV